MNKTILIFGAIFLLSFVVGLIFLSHPAISYEANTSGCSQANIVDNGKDHFCITQPISVNSSYTLKWVEVNTDGSWRIVS